MTTINILCIGDVVGKPGREVLDGYLKQIQAENDIDFTSVNIENSASGFGITKRIYSDLLNLKIDVFTSGNHIYRNKDIMASFNSYKKLLRPANFPANNPGTGYSIFSKGNVKIGFINLIGRVFMGDYDCPFQSADKILDIIKKETDIIVVDFHAEATSEKESLGWFLDGRASVVFGTHTHVQTADDRVLPNGTAYITDIGMAGSEDSVLGMEKEPIIKKFQTQMPTRFTPAKNNSLIFNGIKCKIDVDTGKALSIERLYYRFN
jgi:2',3'-cyclic-nucleotide 2'-phosphodiesterase